jgi:dolichol-phosphate mannosyltransferase
MISAIGNFYARIWLGNRIKDWTSGFRCFRREVLSGIDLSAVRARGYLFQIEVLDRCLHLGFTFEEIPIEFVERRHGRTKLGFIELWEALWGIVVMKFTCRGMPYK